MVREYNTRTVSPSLASLEILRDGRPVCGYPCRFTMGSIVLLEAAGNPIFTESEREPDEPDLFEAFWILQPANIHAAVYLCEDHEERKRILSKYMCGFSRKKRHKIAGELASWIIDIFNALPPEEQKENSDRSPYWYVSTIDVFASQYGYTDEHTMWYLPWARNVCEQKAIIQRLTGERPLEPFTEELESFINIARKVFEDGES